MLELKPGFRIHFVGVGGVSMSALAEFAHLKGCLVSGSDREASALTAHLERLGLRIQIGHSPDVLGEAEAVVYTPAVPRGVPELVVARDREIPILARAEFLAALTQRHRVVGVTGTHGKTTTTAMVGAILSEAGLDPTVLVGGTVRGTDANLQLGEGEMWVVEADEFNRAFLELTPYLAIVTSLDDDHLDSYADLGDIRSAFRQFVGSVPEGGHAVVCGDDPAVGDLSPGPGVRKITYGLASDLDIRAEEVIPDGFGSRFRLICEQKPVGNLRLQAPGDHNVSNALGAAGAGFALGISWGDIRAGLEGFRGVHRRFEVLGEAGGILVVSDYAHHPTEIRVSLDAARKSWTGRIVAVFQPHLYSRTRDLASAFGGALSAADAVWLTDVFPAREDPIPGVSGALIAASVREAGGPEPRYIPLLADLDVAVCDEIRAGDLVLVMGAGNVEQTAHRLYGRLRERADA
jgi:UDP-N-acetylmuramate--alanine ligase